MRRDRLARARGLLAALAVAASLTTAALAAQHGPGLRPPALPGPVPESPAHPPAELDCRGCHVREHQGMLRMYTGTGGRGAPPWPDRMFQVRVECVACHATPVEDERRAGIVGQTFRATEQACLGCHGEKYRGMLKTWLAGLLKMRETVGQKLGAARQALAAADAKATGRDRARKLIEDAAFNVDFVAFAHGSHNVFYASNLLRLSSGWADEALRQLGKTPPKGNDMLVRGGYCATLCHEPAGIKTPDTVAYATRQIPHARHTTEFGAPCTVCHSPDKHKGFVATPATCAGCHHGPANDRCESCHAPVASFYRGQVKALAPIRPNVMADAVTCTGCHDFAHKQTAQAIGQACLACHDKPYLAIMPEWVSGFDAEVRAASGAVQAAEAAVTQARQRGRPVPEAAALLKDARDALDVVRRGNPAHNPVGAETLLQAVRGKAQQAQKAAGR
jgi:hypothetical protein